MTRAKITIGEMRGSGVRGILIYCTDHQCSHSTRTSAEQWGADVRLSDLESILTCSACGKRGVDVRPDFGLHVRPQQTSSRALMELRA